VIPDLSRPGNKESWYKLEVAKRRLVYTLLALGCPVESKFEKPERGLAFEFLADPEANGAPPVLTGHADGVITLNVAEADEVKRERRRLRLHEPYRTLLGLERNRFAVGKTKASLVAGGPQQLAPPTPYSPLP